MGGGMHFFAVGSSALTGIHDFLTLRRVNGRRQPVRIHAGQGLSGEDMERSNGAGRNLARRKAVFRWWGTMIGLAAVAVVGLAPAAQARRGSGFVASPAVFASILLDADTGQVLRETNADAVTYPASLTKMMTLYLTFEALNAGKLRLDQQLPVSQAAAAKNPSKLGLRPGDSVPVRDLILAIVTKSANDAAAVLAEGEGGTEAGFAARMTLKARQLGMNHTYYRNASGLPDPEQQTSARDIARLALALIHDFPREYRYFSTREFDFRGEMVVGHDHLLDWYPGADGIKTGFIVASGYNLATSAVQNGHRMIGVVLGGRTVQSRDREMAAMLDQGFAQVEAGSPMPRREPAPVAVASAVPPPMAAAAPETPQSTRSDVIGKLADAALRHLTPVSRAEAAPLPREEVQPADRWGVQIGAFHGLIAAERAARDASRLRLTRGKREQIVAPPRNERNGMYSVRLEHFTPKDAHAACAILHKRGFACEVVAPEAVKYAND